MASLITGALFIFAPVIGYVSQYRDIQKTSNCDGFSTRVCLILLLSNILRCYFWIGKQFDITLLYQSIVMIIAQLLMLQLCISIKSRESVTNSKSRRSKQSLNIQMTDSIIIIKDNDNNNNNNIDIDNNSNDEDDDENDINIDNNNDDEINLIKTPKSKSKLSLSSSSIKSSTTELSIETTTTASTNNIFNYNNNNNNNNSGYLQNFWEWDSFGSYIFFLAGYSLFFLFLTLVYIFSPNYFEYLGTLSLTIESILGLPQLIQNYKKKSTKGLSLVLISTWFIGDLFKTLYFYYKEQPAQFIFCGTVQLIIDTLITLQIIYYK